MFIFMFIFMFIYSLSNNIEGGNRDLVLEILQRINFTENDANIINASIELLPFAVKDSSSKEKEVKC